MPSVSFTLRMDPELKRQLEDIARRERRSAANVLQHAAQEYVARQQAFTSMVDRLEAQADKGAFVSEDAMTEWFASLGTDNELSEPKADITLKPA